MNARLALQRLIITAALDRLSDTLDEPTCLSSDALSAQFGAHLTRSCARSQLLSTRFPRNARMIARSDIEDRAAPHCRARVADTLADQLAPVLIRVAAELDAEITEARHA